MAIAQAGSMLDGETAQAYGQRVHQLFEAINNADPIMVAAGVKAEVTIKSNGESGYFGRPLGSQVLDLELTQGTTLYYVDGKTGNNSISGQYLKDLASKVQANGVDTIVAITVKK